MKQAMATAQDTRFIRMKEVCAKVGLAKSTLWELVARGQFPQKVHLGEITVAFIESEVEAWMQARAAARNTKA
ncbi:MAG: helix-turn-helix transcriptional regulator [Plesiomonas shigelloides]